MKKILAVLFMAMLVTPVIAGVKYSDGDKYINLGGRIQLQYIHTDQDGHDASDDLRFRRLRTEIEASLYKDWVGKLQFDLGKNENEIKDAFYAYKGIDGMEIAVGNSYIPFSREAMTSSKTQQLVERTFVGDHNYGVPDRQAGVHLTGKAGAIVTYGLSVAKAAHDPDEKKLDWETVISQDLQDDWSQGDMVAGRVDLHPFGILKMSQGDFDRELKATVGVGAYTWNNDGDNLNPYSDEHTSKLDLDTATGFEVSAAIRVAGVSIDAQYNTSDAELMDEGITSGIYRNSEATLENYAIEGGVMIVPSKLELVAGYQAQDADGYATEWTKTSVGLNYFVKKHDIKYMLTYDMGENKDGKVGSDVDEVYVQAQYVF